MGSEMCIRDSHGHAHDVRPAYVLVTPDFWKEIQDHMLPAATVEEGSVHRMAFGVKVYLTEDLPEGQRIALVPDMARHMTGGSDE